MVRVSINEKLKIIQFWCAHDDCNDTLLNEKIESLYTVFAPNSSYRKVIFRSGYRDLAELTSELLKYNVGIK